MASLVNSTNILKRINANSSHTLPKKKKKWRGGNTSKFILWGQHYSESKARKTCHTHKKNYHWQYRHKNSLFKKNQQQQQTELNSTPKELYTMTSVSLTYRDILTYKNKCGITTVTDLLNNSRTSFDKSWYIFVCLGFACFLFVLF